MDQIVSAEAKQEIYGIVKLDSGGERGVFIGDANRVGEDLED